LGFGLCEKLEDVRNDVRLFGVENRKASTLIPIIQKNVKLGSAIYSNCWATYSKLSELGYVIATVNHSENCVDPNTGAHTQKIEGVWGHIMNFLGNHKKPTNKLYESHMAEKWWRRLHENSQEEAFKSINISENFYIFFFILILFF
jgi:hypothetical protein